MSKISKVYDDKEAISRLLEEKEKDLELSVQIGKELLTQNSILEKKNGLLECDVKTANENITQLKKDLTLKNNVISILNDNYGITDASNDYLDENVLNEMTLEMLEQKISKLRDVNYELKENASLLEKDVDKNEAKEKQLFEEMMNHLKSTNYQFNDICK